MELIEFKNLPDTSTPINADNLNNNFNELDKNKQNNAKVLWENASGVAIRKNDNSNVELKNMPNLSGYLGKNVKFYIGYSDRPPRVFEFKITGGLYFPVFYMNSYNGNDTWIINFTIFAHDTTTWVIRLDDSIGISSSGAINKNYGNSDIMLYKVEIID